jgi:predicted Zn-dependent protease
MRPVFRSLVAGTAAALVLAGCATVKTTEAGAVGVDRQQAMLVSSREVNASAAKQYAQVTAQAQQKGVLNRDPAQTARVRAIANRLIPQTAVFRPDASGWRWEVNVIGSDELNAWCMPGGKIAVYSGLIDKLKLSDDEIAAILGHEIAHALREHARERISQQVATSAVVGIGAAVLGVGQAGADLGNMVAQVTFTLPNSRTHEIEADRIGVELAARAGYDPRAAVSLWQKMSKAGDGGPPQFLSTHPSPENRIKDLEVYAQRVMPLYEATRKK